MKATPHGTIYFVCLQSLIPLLDDPTKLMGVVYDLLSPGNSTALGGVRYSTVKLLHDLAQTAALQHLQPAAECLAIMHSRERNVLTGMQFAASTKGLEMLQTPGSSAITASPAGAALLLTHCMFLLCIADMGHIQATRAACGTIIDYSASLLKQSRKKDEWNAVSLTDMLRSASNQAVGRSIGLGLLSSGWQGVKQWIELPFLPVNVRRNVMGVASHLLDATCKEGPSLSNSRAPGGLPGLPPSLHTDLHHIRNTEDAEADPLSNLHHLQVHRRARALRRTLGQLQYLTLETKTTVVLPIALAALLDTLQSVAKQANMGGLKDAALELIGALAKEVQWGTWVALLRRLLRWVAGQGPFAGAGRLVLKTLVRAVCTVVDGFHFDMGSDEDWEADENDWKLPAEDSGDSKEEKDEDMAGGDAKDEEGGAVEEGVDEDVDNEADEDQDGRGSALSPEVHPKVVRSTIQKAILPSLVGLMRENSRGPWEKRSRGADAEGGVRVFVAAALVRLLRQLPFSVCRRESVKAFLRVCGALREREQEARDSAREALVEVSY